MIEMFDPGYDLRTIVTAAVVIPIVSFTAVGVARIFGRLFRRWSAFTGRVIRSTVVESIEAALAPRFDHLEDRFATLVAENSRSHGEVVSRLDTIEDRLDVLESRRRHDRYAPTDDPDDRPDR